ncbi:uncharacterized protein LOC144989360 [Oryzias latipes]
MKLEGSSPGAASSPGSGISGALDSIDKKLSSLDGRLNLLEILHREFQGLRESLEFSQQQVRELAAENQALRESVKTLSSDTACLSEENRSIKESLLDLQSRSMRDNLVIAGVPEEAGEDPEATVKRFMEAHLKLPKEEVQKIAFRRVHRLGGRRSNNQRRRPIVAKFDNYKQKEMVKGRGRELRGTHFSVNDQFPVEILRRRKILFPLRKKHLANGSRAVVSVDKLFVDGRLFQDPEITPWLC